MTQTWNKYILWFAQEHVDFREAEFYSIMTMFDLEYSVVSQNLENPFWVVEFPDDSAALQYAGRSVALKCLLELWSHGKTIDEFHSNLKTFIDKNELELQEYFVPEKSFKITVETYNKHFSQKEKVEKIESFDYLPIKGNVDLKTPDTELWYIEFWGLDPKNVPASPDDFLFGRFLSEGQRHLIKELSLKKRKFIGNTSMDPQLSLLMANQGLVKTGDLVFDPFVGTGSLLVSAAKFGGYVLGADIDYMMIHARSRPSRISQKVREKDESIRSNLKQYGCESRYIDVLVSDFSNPLWTDNIKFNSIITDPPYGIREAVEKVETKINNKAPENIRDLPHYPSTSHYALRHLYTDLLEFASKHLEIGGRLVCWFPYHKDDYTDKLVPQHHHLDLIANSEQHLSGQTCRRLLTYEKCPEPILNSKDTLVEGMESELTDFRDRYFNNGIESRAERRLHRAAMRQVGYIEAVKRGKVPQNSQEMKRMLNKARFK